jgi:hypothetical protein
MAGLEELSSGSGFGPGAANFSEATERMYAAFNADDRSGFDQAIADVARAEALMEEENLLHVENRFSAEPSPDNPTGLPSGQ